MDKKEKTSKVKEVSAPEVALNGIQYGSGNIELTFINQSNDMNNSNVVIFQKNVTTSFDEVAIAWRVIKNCGRGWSHKFDYPHEFSVGAEDAYGNQAGLQLGRFGQKWVVSETASGEALQLGNDYASSISEVEISNSLIKGAVNANIYKDGKILISKTGVVPGQKAIFSFKPTIWIGVVSQVEEGMVMNSAILSDINTEISLLGITKANIIMTGGGMGPSARPFQFYLEPTV